MPLVHNRRKDTDGIAPTRVAQRESGCETEICRDSSDRHLFVEEDDWAIRSILAALTIGGVGTELQVANSLFRADLNGLLGCHTFSVSR